MGLKTQNSSWAWVTSALDENEAEKALVLAASLKSVFSSAKLVVITSAILPEAIRSKLYKHFDLVSLMDETVPICNDYAKVFAFSLTVFRGCIYLPPNSLVLKKCDELFSNISRPNFFVGLQSTATSSIFLLKPSIEHFHCLKNIWKNKAKGTNGFNIYLEEYAQNNRLEVMKLEAQLCQELKISEGKLFDGFAKEVGVVNFGSFDPKNCNLTSAHRLGLLEKFAIDRWWNIYQAEVNGKLGNPEMVREGKLGSKQFGNEPIAIIGMSCRYPGANTLDEFWQLMIEGREGVRQLPSHRWQKGTTIATASAKNRKAIAGFLDFPIDEFDSKFFEISQKEAEFLDPQQRLLHELTWEALEDASLNPEGLRGSHTGIFVGSWIHDYKDLAVKATDLDFFRVYMGNSIAATASRLSHFYKTTGPSIGTESGCSSAIVALDMAFKSLRSHETNLAMAMGVNLFLHPFDQQTMSFVLAPDGRCKTFDSKADGFGRAEGIGVLILKRMSDAIADGDKIWALIRGSAISQEGVSKSIGTPTVHCESLAMELALKDGGVLPKEVSFVEAHGTGTSVGDPLEMAAIAKVYSKDRTEPLWVGSVKTNIGHTEAVSGITGIIKVVLSMKNEMIPPHLHFNELNPEINLDAIPARIPLQPEEWPRDPQGLPRIAGVSSFGISGTDGHAIIQEPPILDMDGSLSFDLKRSRPMHIMKITAKTSDALDTLLGRYETMLEQQLDNQFGDIAYTANIGRATYSHRAVIIGKDNAEALKVLKGGSFKRKEVHEIVEAKLCFLFTGQGSQYHGMAHELYKTSPVFRMAFDKCDALLQLLFKINIRDVMWNLDSEGVGFTGDKGLLNRTIYSQVAIFVVEYCLLRLWNSWGIMPDFVLGHSLGEFAAAVAANILDLETALTMLINRSLLIDGLPQGKMLVVKAGPKDVRQLLASFVKEGEYGPNLDIDFAAVNSPDQTVLAGDSGIINEFSAFCTKKEVKNMELAATHAFHSKHMDPILDEYGRIVQDAISLSDSNENSFSSNCKYISGMEGRLITELEEIRNPEYWIRHTREKVNFIEASNAALDAGCNLFIEIGPSPVLSTFIMSNAGSVNGSEFMCLPSLRKNHGEWTTLLDSLTKLFLSDFANVNIDWSGFDQYYRKQKVDLPFYPFNRKKIWVDFRSTGGQLHPLVGRVLPNASKSTIFEGEFTLKQISYLNDHAIGNTVIFPGAALLEMCMVAGHSAVQGLRDEFSRPGRPIVIRGLRIEAPLALQDGKSCLLQTLVDLNEKEEDNLGYSIKVHNWFQNRTDGGNSDDDGQWKCHVSANFLPLVVDEEKCRIGKINIDEMKENWEKMSGTKDLYEKLHEVGFSFGPTFHSLACGWSKASTAEGKAFELKPDENDDGILFEVKVPTDNHEVYLVHPVILDAMLQASMIHMNKEKLHKKLYVPVCIGEFTWLSDGSGDPSRYIYCKDIKNAPEDKIGRTQLTTFLLDGSGSVLASMCGVECIETTVKLVESIIQQQSYVMPQLWEEIWKVKSGPLDKRACSVPIPQGDEATLSDEIIQTCEKLNQMDENEIKVYHHLDNLTVVYFIRALYKLGWVPKLEERIFLKEFVTQYRIIDVAWNFTKYFFGELAREGILTIVEEDEYLVKELPETKETIEMLCMNLVQEDEASRGDYRIISEMGKCLPDFLLRKTSPLDKLFPDDNLSVPNLGSFYNSIRPWVSRSGEILNNALSTFKHLFNTKDNSNVTFRVLEVGAGTGTGTKDYLAFLDSNEINYEYTFTDLSAAFFINAEVQFEKYKDKMKFKKFNIEEDPLAQGFSPEYYDVIIACEVIHATKDIRQTLSNLRILLKTNGHIQITETTKPDRRITLLVGLLEGYWRFTDTDLRPCHATMSKEKWVSVLKTLGYDRAFSIGCYNDVHSYIFAFASQEYSIADGTKSLFRQLELATSKIHSEHDDPQHHQQNRYSWLIFCDNSDASKEIQRRLKLLNRSIFVIGKGKFYSKRSFDPETGKKKILKVLRSLEGDFFEGIIYFWSLTPDVEDDQEQLSLPFLHLCQGVLELHKASRVYVFTQGAFIGQEDCSCLHPQSATIWGIAKAFRNEQPDIGMHCIDLSPDKALNEQINEMFHELFWTGDGEELVAFRDGKRLVPRLASLKIMDESLSLPTFCERFQLLLPTTKSISDLEFGILPKYNLKEDEIEIQIKAAALNFRDIFAVLKPIAQFDNVNSIGSDYAGVVTKIGPSVTKCKVGDPVFGMNTEQQALPSHVKTKENMVMPIPENMTFAEAATIPAVFATALYSLVSIAKITRGDVILIHTASGGVGLSAIQIAQHFGATIIATAGSRRKRAYLKSLGIGHVFHSRNTDYGEEILKVTSGRGVDIVLNSLTGPGFKETSLRACSKHARFVEMSKLNIWKKEAVQQLRPDVDYTVADLTSLEEGEWKELLDRMMKSMEENFVKPIPYVRYDALNIRQALGYLQKAKHIGKVVCIMPDDMKLSRKNMTGPNSTPKINLFNDRSTYIITGGLGGIGFEVATFMLESGAKHLILIGRSPPKPEIENVIKSWNSGTKEDVGFTKHVEAWQADVGDYQQVKEMLEKIKGDGAQWPPLRGIMHAAGVLHDGTIPNQTWTKFMKTYNAKQKGTMNLHNLTRNYRLEHFVLFSSVTSLFGSPGQANHSASNAFEDALAQYRHSNGLPATSINWANWGECGVAQDIDFPGIRPIATTQGLRALEAVLKSNRLQTSVMNVDSFGMVAKLFPKVKGYVDDKRLLGDVKAPTLIINTDQFWADVDKAEEPENKVDVFKRYIKNMLKNTLKMDPDESIDDNAEFQSLGVDSLMLLEMKNYLQNLFGSRLTLTAAHLKDCNSTGALAVRLVDILTGRNTQENEDDRDDNELTLNTESFEDVDKFVESAPTIIAN